MMGTIKCIITDDEPIARQIIRGYCAQIPYIEIVGECENAMEALEILRNKSVDLMFLDINMPMLNGLAMIKSMTTKPAVVITTAYKEYALDAFEEEVLDYLLKPFSFERFIKAVQKIKIPVQNESFETNANITMSKPHEDGFDGIFLKIGKVIYRFAFKNILFCEAQQNYTRIVSIDDDVRIYQTLTQIESQLPTFSFTRVHRSFVINKDHVVKIDGSVILIGSHSVPIGTNYRESFLQSLGLG
jgi:two-component system, LytTR family, response regulator